MKGDVKRKKGPEKPTAFQDPKIELVFQNTATATRRTSRAHSHATAHWLTTMMVAHLPPSSRLTDATAAMQGVYSRQNTSRGAACAGVRAAVRAAVEPKRTSSEDTTLSLAIKPVMRAVEMRQSAKPSGANSGAISPAMRARMLACGSAVSRSCKSKFCKNQMTMVAAKMTVKAFCKKSRAFSHSSCATFSGRAGGSWAAP